MTRNLIVDNKPDAKIITHDYDGESWCCWVVADTEEAAMKYLDSTHYSGPGGSFCRPPFRIPHPKKVVYYQRGGLDI